MLLTKLSQQLGRETFSQRLDELTTTVNELHPILDRVVDVS
jgi:hypothetical protein